MVVDVRFMVYFVEEGNLYLFGVGIIFRESKGGINIKFSIFGMIIVKIIY